MHDGRELGWAIFGDPEGDTVFWFHGTPGASNQHAARLMPTPANIVA